MENLKRKIKEQQDSYEEKKSGYMRCAYCIHTRAYARKLKHKNTNKNTKQNQKKNQKKQKKQKQKINTKN